MAQLDEATSANALLSKFGVFGLVGVTLAIDGADTTAIDVNVTAGATAFLFKNGQFLDGAVSPALAGAVLGGNTTTGAYTVWVDINPTGDELLPCIYTVALTGAGAPTPSAIPLGTFAVASGVITPGSVVNEQAGLHGFVAYTT